MQTPYSPDTHPFFRKKNTKEKILHTAHELFLKKGYGSTSIDDILKQVSIAKGTFYHHFVSKESLLEAVTSNLFLDGFKELIRRMDDLKITNPVEKLNALFRISLQLKDENLDSMLLVLQAMLLESNLSLRFFVKNKNKEYGMHVLEKILQEGKEMGTFPIQNPKLTAEILCSILDSLSDKLEMDLLGKSKEDIQGLVAEYQSAMEKILGLPPDSIQILDIPSYQSIQKKIQDYKDHSLV